MSSQARKPKVKWTEQMNKDVLECKKKAQELVSSENPPCNENGRKRGYIEVMKELWDDIRYKNLQLKSQNLWDQASRLEKIRNNRTDLSIRERSVDGGMITITTATIDDAYYEVTTWRKNTFLVSYGKLVVTLLTS